MKDVNDGWNEADPSRPLGMQYVLWSPQGVVANECFMGRFKGSDDYLRSKVRLNLFLRGSVETDCVFSSKSTSMLRSRLSSMPTF